MDVAAHLIALHNVVVIILYYNVMQLR